MPIRQKTIIVIALCALSSVYSMDPEKENDFSLAHTTTIVNNNAIHDEIDDSVDKTLKKSPPPEGEVKQNKEEIETNKSKTESEIFTQNIENEPRVRFKFPEKKPIKLSGFYKKIML